MNSETKNLIEKNWSAIRTFSLYRRYSTIYNLSIKNNDIMSTLQSSDVTTIFEEQSWKFKCQASIGSILYNNGEQTLRYWHASMGRDRLFDAPVLIQNASDYQNFINELSKRDYMEQASQDRPNTSWSIHLLTNLTIYVYPITNHPIGCPTLLSESTKCNKAIVCSDLDSNGKVYTDNLCLFRALALSRHKNDSLATTTKLYFEDYIQARNIDCKDFKGVSIDELKFVERICSTSINVYERVKDKDSYFGKMIYRSSTNYKHKLNLHLENNHYAWIKNLSLYVKSYKCEFCGKLLKAAKTLKEHSLSCSSISKRYYPSGIYSPTKSVIEKLIEEEIVTTARFFPYVATIDCEAYFDVQSLPSDTKTIHWQNQHKLASISICSNVPGFKSPVNFIKEDCSEYELVKSAMTHLEKLSDVCYEKLKREYHDIFLKIEIMRNQQIITEKRQADWRGIDKIETKFDSLKDELDAYLRIIPVFGFNSASYDIPLIKEHMIRYLLEEDGAIQFVVKRGNKYMCIQTDKLRFLDVLNYLAPGFSYSSYLKAMEVEESKLCWPYDIFTSMSVLKRKEFPKYEEFYNKLTESNISIDDYNRCKRVWKENDMKTLRDFLQMYNNQDVRPLLWLWKNK